MSINNVPNSVSSLNGLNTGVAGAVFNLKAGVDCDAGSLMLISADGLAYPAQTADYASAPNLYDKPIQPTQVSATVAPQRERYNVLQAPNGDIYVAGTVPASSNAYSMAVYRYSAGGALLGYNLVEGFQSTNYDPRMSFLSSGDIVVKYSDTTNLRFAILSPVLAVICAPTLIDTVGNGDTSGTMIALSGGGFMVTYVAYNTSSQYIAVYDNLGAVVTAKKVLKAGVGITRIAQLSNGNVAFLQLGVAVASIGVLSPTGAVVVPFFNGDSSLSVVVDLSVMPGYFALGVSQGSGNVLRVRVYSNDGIQQGATMELPCYAATTNGIRLISDGTFFWLSYVPSSGIQNLARISTAGAIKIWGMPTAGANRTASACFDMFYERNRLVIFCIDPPGAGGSYSMTVFNTVTFAQESHNNTGFSTSALDGNTKVIPGGDFTAIYLGVNGSNALCLTAVKYIGASIVGVSAAAAAAGVFVPVSAQSGAYGINRLKGSAAKVFDHSSATTMGNKGTVLNYGAILKGY